MLKWNPGNSSSLEESGYRQSQLYPASRTGHWSDGCIGALCVILMASGWISCPDIYHGLCAPRQFAMRLVPLLNTLYFENKIKEIYGHWEIYIKIFFLDWKLFTIFCLQLFLRGIFMVDNFFLIIFYFPSWVFISMQFIYHFTFLQYLLFLFKLCFIVVFLFEFHYFSMQIV